MLTSEIVETVSEENVEEISAEENEIVSEEITEEISTEEFLDVEISETISEIVVETVVYTTDPIAVKSLQVIVCILCIFLVAGICKFIYKFLDSIFII